MLNGLDAYKWLLLCATFERQAWEPDRRYGRFDGTLVDYMLKNDWYG